MQNQISPFIKHLRRYFAAYGGPSAIFGSPLFLIAVLISAISYNSWLNNDWPETTKDLIPNLLGFSLGTYSIIFSLVTARIKRAMKAVNGPTGASRLEEINATFFHFIFVQVVALLWAMVYQGTLLTDLIALDNNQRPYLVSVFNFGRYLGSFIGYLLVAYSFLLTLGAALAVYRLALIVDPQEE